MEVLDPGEIVTIDVVTFDDAGDYADPDSGSIVIQVPTTGAESHDLSEWVRDDQGRYHFDFTTSVQGAYPYRVEVAGVHVSGGESSVFVVGNAGYDGPFEQWCTWEEVTRMPVLQLFNELQADVLDSFDVREQQSIIDAASEVMWNLSGRIYPGIRTVRRSLAMRCSWCGAWWWMPYWYGWHLCGCAASMAQSVRINGRYPVLAMVDVQVKGESVDPSTYYLADNVLVRTGGDSWPVCTSLDSPADFTATYVTGVAVPEAGRRAARELVANDVAQGLAAACANSEDERTVMIVREGVTLRLQDAATMLAQQSTGFRGPDLWLRSLKDGRQSRPGIFDHQRARARTGRGW